MREQQGVDIRNKEERQKFIEKLENKGYIVDETIFSRNYIISGIFPIIVNLKNKKISMMGNVTTSACAVQSKVLISQEEFWKSLSFQNTNIKDGIIGFAVGDALGVPAEFKSRDELKRYPITDMKADGTYNVPAGTWSDDTSMTLATLDSIIETQTIDANDMASKFLKWFRNAEYTATNECFDIGRTTLQALAKFELQPDDASNCGGNGEYDNGNGSLMRILPIAYYIYYKNITDNQEIYNIIKDVSSITHAHEISLLGCYIYVKYVLELLNGKDKVQAYRNIQQQDYTLFSDYSVSKYSRILRDDIANVPVDDISSSGYVVSTLEAVYWLFLNAKDYNTTILNAVNLGDDTDTVGAILGGLLGIQYGIDSIKESWKHQLKRYDYIVSLCDKFNMVFERGN